MSPLKTIRTHNLMSHEDVIIELPKKGLVVFTGENSHGKSVIAKILKDLISGDISQKKVRKSDIRKKVNGRPNTEGSMEIVRYDGVALLLNLNLEASLTWVRLTRSNGEQVTRYLSDKNIPELIEEFGFHYNDKRDISLHISDPEDALLFFKTGHAANGEIIAPAVEDIEAQKRIDWLTSQYQDAITIRRRYTENLQIESAAKEALTIYDIGEEEKLRDRCRKCAVILNNFYTPNIVELQPVPKILTIQVPKLKLASLSLVPLVYTIYTPKPQPIKPLWEAVETVRKGVCPECQRPFFAHQTCTNETLTSTLL